MRKDREKAQQLRRNGMSYKAIHQKLGIPVATLSDWFRALPWSIDLKEKLTEKASFSSPEKLKLIVTGTKRRWAVWRNEADEEATREFSVFEKNPLFLAGLMLYWGEGTKRGSVVRLINNEPEMIKIFNSFLQLVGVPKDKIFLSLLLYPDLIDLVQKNFWNRATGISVAQFKKSVFIVGRNPIRRMSYGVCTIMVYSSKLKIKILKWIELSKDQLIASRLV